MRLDPNLGMVILEPGEVVRVVQGDLKERFECGKLVELVALDEGAMLSSEPKKEADDTAGV